MDGRLGEKQDAHPHLHAPVQSAEDRRVFLAVNAEQLEACLADPYAWGGVAADMDLADSLSVTVTPTIFLDGRPIAGALKPWMMEKAIAALADLPAPAPSPR